MENANHCTPGLSRVVWNYLLGCTLYLTHTLLLHFETVPNSKKLQTATEMWLSNDFKIQIA